MNSTPPLSLLILFAFSLFSCSPRNFVLTSVSPPAKEGEGLRLMSSEAGKLYASWIGQQNDTTWALRYRSWSGKEWSETRTIVEGGPDWFVNWADTPRLGKYAGTDGPLVASWLVKSDRRNPYNHHLLLSQSDAGGAGWSPPFSPHPIDVPAFFGLNRFVPLSDSTLLLVWMDGRTTQVRDPRSGRLFPNPNGALYLHAAKLHPSGHISGETVLDRTISQLCPIDAVRTPDGALVAYRDQQAGKEQDIAVIRYADGQWSESRIVHPDRWRFSQMVLEGPALDASGERVAVAWFSSPNDSARVQVALSGDGGRTFAPPVEVDNGQPIGKVDVSWTAGGRALVSWVEKAEDGGRLMLAEVEMNGNIRRKQAVAAIPAEPAYGFPVLESAGRKALLFWKQNDQTFTGVRVKR